MSDTTTPAAPCANCLCLQARIDVLERQLAQLQATVTLLQQQLAAARKDSSTSSKPPSSDLVKPPKPAPPDGRARKPGGQPGHPRHLRPLLPPERLSAPPRVIALSSCPCCRGSLSPCEDPPRIAQQVELPAPSLLAREYHARPGYCPACRAVFYPDLPDEVVNGGLCGPRLSALIAFLKGGCHASFSTVRKFLRDVAGVTLSRGHLAKVIAKVTDALEQPYQQLLEDLPTQAALNVDETGHKDGGRAMWTWCFRAGLYTLFRIDKRRSADVLIDVLGREFDGVIGCDCFSAYRRYMGECGVTVQFCLAHLIRDVKYLLTLADGPAVAYGERLRVALRDLFGVIHQRETLSREEFERRLLQQREAMLRAGTTRVPAAQAAQALGKRLAKYGASYFEFITTPDIGPTNNLAEQAIRFVVIDRKVTQGTRSEQGQRWSERIWTVVATCAQQGRSVFDYLCGAVEAHFNGREVPGLLPEGS